MYFGVTFCSLIVLCMIIKSEAENKDCPQALTCSHDMLKTCARNTLGHVRTFMDSCEMCEHNCQYNADYAYTLIAECEKFHSSTVTRTTESTGTSRRVPTESTSTSDSVPTVSTSTSDSVPTVSTSTLDSVATVRTTEYYPKKPGDLPPFRTKLYGLNLNKNTYDGDY